MSGQRSESSSRHTTSGYRSEPTAKKKVGLVLGGGGILGGAWLVGALYALTQAAGWDPATADYVVGTSAGSVVSALVASGMPPWFLVHHQRGGSVEGMIDQFGDRLEDADEQSRRLFEWTGSVPRPVLGSPRLALRATLRPWRFPGTAVLSGWLGRGFLSNEEVGRIIRAVVHEGWSAHPNLWIVAVDYETGKRVVFGEDGAPPAELAEAVEASCAIPGLYRPVRIGERYYIDGGAWSPSNADLLVRTDADIVVVMNPMSSLQPGIPAGLLQRFDRRIRRATGRRLGHEARMLREAGKQVLLVQPRDLDLEVMGVNMMDPSRRVDTLEMALRTVGERLKDDDAGGVLSALGRVGKAGK
jgi:NTE family protein